MSWHDDYNSKRMSAEKAVSLIQSGSRVFYGGNANMPLALMRAAAVRCKSLENVKVTHVLVLGEDPLAAPEMAPHVRHHSLFVGPSDRLAVNEGRADYVPIFLYEIPRIFETSFPLDVAMVQVSKPDEHGFMSFGLEALAARAAIQHAKKVIVQVNEKTPRVLGNAFVHVSRVDAVVEHTEPMTSLTPRPASDIEKKIGGFIRGLIEDGSCIQMGIGGIPDAVFNSLDGLHDLGIHTEMLSDGAMRAIQRGIVTGARKNIHQGKAVITFALGSQELYDFLDNNPMIEAQPVEYCNDPYVVSQNEKMVAVNGAIEVDITGQVCSDSIGTRIFSGFGGQVDYIRGAARSKGGKPIIALPSTGKSKDGKLFSKIVPMLKPGAGVVTTRADVHYVVTEYGVAELFGRNLHQRAEALINVAHPDFRSELTQMAKDRRIL